MRAKRNEKNLAMTWIDYKKIYDIVPQSWIAYCQKIYKISDKVLNFIEKTMETLRVKLTADGRKLAEAKIQRDIFRGDGLSPFPFVIAMIPLKHVQRKCTGGYKLSNRNEISITGTT